MGEKSSAIFELNKKNNEFNSEYWSARDFYRLLEYESWRNFVNVLDKAKEACENSGFDVGEHFRKVEYIAQTGSNAKRDIGDYQLSRYACYLIVQNADPSKNVVALGQTYFAVQTRKQELQESQAYKNLKTEEDRRLFLRDEMKKHNLKLADAAKQAGILEPLDYAIFQDHGYKGLYGGLNQKEIHQMRGLKKSQKILDHMGSTELAANLFRATQTEEKLKRENIKGINAANITHYEVGKKVRITIQELGGDMPETLPVEESIKIIEQKKKRELKAASKMSKKSK
jgi:DNA-damage-inducible protein D